MLKIRIYKKGSVVMVFAIIAAVFIGAFILAVFQTLWWLVIPLIAIIIVLSIVIKKRKKKKGTDAVLQLAEAFEDTGFVRLLGEEVGQRMTDSLTNKAKASVEYSIGKHEATVAFSRYSFIDYDFRDIVNVSECEAMAYAVQEVAKNFIKENVEYDRITFNVRESFNAQSLLYRIVLIAEIS